jgi:hypothetical protein
MNIRRITRTAFGIAVSAAVVLGSANAASASDQLAPYDLDGDGWADAWFGDANGDGWFDGALLDRNEDGYTDGLAYDLSGNGVFDFYTLDNNQNGYSEIYASDSNDDGAIDVVWLDMNENGSEDSNEQMYPTHAIVGGAPTYDGLGGLLLTAAHITGKATWGSGDSDRDGIYDSSDYYWDDPTR